MIKLNLITPFFKLSDKNKSHFINKLMSDKSEFSKIKSDSVFKVTSIEGSSVGSHVITAKKFL